MSKTKTNLRQALSGESQANIRYMGYAGKAETEGYPAVAKLFRAVARAELKHAISLQCALGEDREIIEDLQSADKIRTHIAKLESEGAVKGTIENLKTAIEGETYEFKKMYPAMVQDAVAEKDMQARYSFEYAMSIEMEHAQLFKKALNDPQANAEAAYYVCPVCGHTVYENPPKKCPYCGVKAKQFEKVD